MHTADQGNTVRITELMKPPHPPKIELPILQPGFSGELQCCCFSIIYCFQYIKALLFWATEFVTTNQIDSEAHNICICKMEADPDSVVFSLFSELPHTIQNENDLWDSMHYGMIAIMDFDWEFMILPFISSFPLLSTCHCAAVLSFHLTELTNAGEHSNQS